MSSRNSHAQQKVRKIFKEKMLDKEMLKAYRGRIGQVLCFSCQKSFATKEKLWLVNYRSKFNSTVTVALCPECLEREEKGESNHGKG